MDILDLPLNGEFLKVIGSALVGAMGFKIIERFLNAKEMVDEQASLRSELRTELDKVREEVNQLKEEVTEWREKYYQQVEINTRMQLEMGIMRNELDEYKTKISDEIYILPPLKTDE